SAADRDTMAESEIMRATLSRRIVELNNGIVFKRENVVLGDDCKNNPIAVLEKDQLLALFNALEVCGAGGGSELTVPAFGNIHAVAQYSDRIDELYAVDEIRYRISATVKSYAEEIGCWNTQTEECYRLTRNAGSLVWESTTREVITLDSLQAVLERFA
ncbi:MAG: hypothetical protein K2H43_06805, partial [Clostridia bacterium]|nr:hypothetical protein [Clostridia bacterium]